MNKLITIIVSFLILGCSNQSPDNNQSATSAWGKPSPNSPVPAENNGKQNNGLLQNLAGANENQNNTENQKPLNPASDINNTLNKGGCSHMFVGGIAPIIVSAEYANAIKPKYEQLCYRSFALGHSGLTRTSIWVAEVLDKEIIKRADRVERNDIFEEDKNLKKENRSTLKDYRGSGYHRGHLAAAANMPSNAANNESFLLSNMVPQNGKMNSGIWRELESNVRNEARKRKVYVVTGPIFIGSNKAINKRVLVPSAMYKAMFAVDKGVVVFVADNDDSNRMKNLSQEQFIKIYGIDPFPALKGEVRRFNIANGTLEGTTENSKANQNKNDKDLRNNSNYKCTGLAKTKEDVFFFKEDAFIKKHGRSPAVNEWDCTRIR